MTDEQHIELLQVLRNCNAMVLISGYDNEIYRDLLADWRMSSTIATASAGVGTKKATEILWMNRSAFERLDDERNTLFKQVS